HDFRFPDGVSVQSTRNLVIEARWNWQVSRNGREVSVKLTERNLMACRVFRNCGSVTEKGDERPACHLMGWGRGPALAARPWWRWFASHSPSRERGGPCRSRRAESSPAC